MKEMVCPTCRGIGWFKERTYLNGQWVQESVCETCKGTGKIPVAEPKTHFEVITQSPEKLAAFIAAIECSRSYSVMMPNMEEARQEAIAWLNQEVTDESQEEEKQ